MINQQLCVVCYRIADRPTPKVASHQQQCASCRTMIWVARKSPAAPPKICIQCVQSDGAIADLKLIAAGGHASRRKPSYE